MANWMSGIYQAASGLDAARYGLSVVSQNMANAANTGYTRQTAQQATVDMGAVSGIWSGRGSMGGVTISGTTRNTDIVLDARTRSEAAKSALADTTKSQLTGIEGVFGEPSDSGLAKQLDDFWKSWGTVASSPNTPAARTVLLRNASGVAGTLNAMSSALSDTAEQIGRAVTQDVSTVNTTAARLAEVNGQIQAGTAVGGNVNALLDERDTLLSSLSSLSGATATIEANGTATVAIGGQTLVSGVDTSVLDVDSTYQASVGGVPTTIAAGSIAARVSALTTTLPAYSSTLDSVAMALADTVNTALTGGYDRNGDPGAAMFTGTGAADLQVDLTDPAKIAASGVPGGSLDNSVAAALSQAALRPGSADSLFTALVGNVAAASSTASQRAATQTAVHDYVTNLKTSMSGVSFDEEAASMLTYQQAFNASSRVLTAIDSMLDTLINHTGVVGRA